MNKLFLVCNLYRKRFFIIITLVSSLQLHADIQSRRNLNKEIAQQESLWFDQAEKLISDFIDDEKNIAKKDTMPISLALLSVFDQVKKVAEESSLFVNFKHNIHRLAHLVSSKDEQQPLLLSVDDCSDVVSQPKEQGLEVYAFAGTMSGAGSSGNSGRTGTSRGNSGIRVNGPSGGAGPAADFKPAKVEIKDMIPQARDKPELSRQAKENSRDGNSSQNARKPSRAETMAEIRTQFFDRQKEQHVEDKVEPNKPLVQAIKAAPQQNNQDNKISQRNDSMSKLRDFVSTNSFPAIKDTGDTELDSKIRKSGAPDDQLKARPTYKNGQEASLFGINTKTLNNRNYEEFTGVKSQNGSGLTRDDFIVDKNRDKFIPDATVARPKPSTKTMQPESSIIGVVVGFIVSSLFAGSSTTVIDQQESSCDRETKEESYLDEIKSGEQSLPSTTVIDVQSEPQTAGEPLSIAMHKARAQGQRRARILECQEAQAAIAACAAGRDSLDSSAVSLQGVSDFDCEEYADNNPELPDNAVASAAVIFTAGGTGLAGSAVGSTVLSFVPQALMCTVLYTGGSYLVHLIKNYKQNKNETPGEKAVREAAEKFASDFQYALNATLQIGTCGVIPESSTFYIAMCYGYGNDPYAKVITIVDIHYKQHIFVVPDNLINRVFQVSDGSWNQNLDIPSRYLVSQSTIDAVNATKKAQVQAVHDAKVKDQQDAADAVLARVEKNLTSSLKKISENKIESKEHLLPIQGASGIFQAARSADGTILRDETGAYFDIQGNCYVLSKDEKQWNVKVLAYGSTNIIDVAKETIPNNTGCGHPDPEWNKPTILDHPMPPIEKPEPLVHPKYEDEQPGNEGCGHKDPELDKIDRTQGCGGLQYPKLTQDDLVLQAQKQKSGILNAYEKKQPTAEDIKREEDFKRAHPHGKAHDSDKHNQNSPDGVGKPPRDAQKALDESFEVEESTQRIAVQDNKVVIFQRTGDGLYHGYVVEDLNSLQKKYKEALVDNGYMKDATAKKLIKK